MNLIPKTLAVFLIGVVISAAAGETSLARDVSQTNRVDYSKADATNSFRHPIRWYEKPSKDPLTVLKELQADPENQFSGSPVFVPQGAYILQPSVSGPDAPPSSAQRFTAWNDHPLYKQSDAANFPAAIQYGAATPPTPEVTGTSFASEGVPIQFADQKLRGADLAAEKERPLDNASLDGAPGPGAPQPQIASPEPTPAVLGFIFLAVWRTLTLFRRRQP